MALHFRTKVPIMADDSVPEGLVERFALNGVELVAERFSARKATTRVFVLVHGIGMGRTVFRSLTDLLLDHGSVITIDQPGYGEAPEPDHTPTMEETADLIAAYLRSRGIPPVVLIGHSMGTQVVTEVAARHPSTVKRLVVVAPTVDVHARRASTQIWRLTRDLLGENPVVLYRGGREYLRAGPHLLRKMRVMLDHRPELAYPRVNAPTLVLRGEHDPVAPVSWCRSVTEALPNSQFEEIPDHGHESMIRNAEDAARLILRFVSE